MKVNELRIGNYVYYQQPDIYGVVKTIDEDGCIIEYIGNGFPFNFKQSSIQPIPLTEEWLLKFGFKMEKGWFVLKRLELFNINNNYFTTPSKDLVSVDIKYVHQLQNLYFSLTGGELEIENND